MELSYLDLWEAVPLKSLRKLLPALLLLLLLAPGAVAQMPQLRGYDASQAQKYIYVTFGNYFSDGYGSYGPVLWRVLGPGIPGEDDVSTDGVGEEDNALKAANEDVITAENADVFCLMTEYIIDFHQYNEVRDTRDGEALTYKDSEMYRYITGTSRELDAEGKPTSILGWLFTQDEQAVLMDMPERGLISLPSRKGELFRRDYGFMNEDFRECLRRQATGTHFAFDQGLKYIVDAWSWYFTTDRRRVGFRWIVGDNGHTSVAGADREGGVRLVCYPHTSQLECLGGSGTVSDPYRLVTRSAYLRGLKDEAHATLRQAVQSSVRQAVFAASRAEAAAQAREDEAVRLAAQAQAREAERIEALKATGRRLLSRMRITRHEAKRSAVRALDSLLAPKPLPAPSADPQASPAVIFRPSQP